MMECGTCTDFNSIYVSASALILACSLSCAELEEFDLSTRGVVPGFSYRFFPLSQSNFCRSCRHSPSDFESGNSEPVV